MHDFTTPMMRQYMEIKEKYKDCLLFFRMGDFYELFLEDAHIGAKVLDIALTGRSKGKDGRVPMAGVPYHAVDSYLAKLVKAGYKVAICEQLSEPSAGGIVDRDVIRIVTPGTVLDEKSLSQKDHNYILSIIRKGTIVGLALADISTGLFQITELDLKKNTKALSDELTKLSPSECILPEDLYNDPDFLKTIRHLVGVNIYPVQQSETYIQNAKKIIKEQFGQQVALNGDMKTMTYAQQASALLIGYLQYTQKNKLPHCRTITLMTDQSQMLLDRTTMLNLELFSTLRDMDRAGSLIHFLDKTTTAMGGRLLRIWVKRPLIEESEITARHIAVAELISNKPLQQLLRTQLQDISDIERLIARLALSSGNARDLISLKNSIEYILSIKKTLGSSESPLLRHLAGMIEADLSEVSTYIEKRIREEPPFDTKIGDMIAPGVNAELDKIHSVLNNNKSWLEAFEKAEREKTGITSLKVRFNKVVGFYIEISKSNLDHAPERYMRKQTLVNGERFITDELKKKEEIILTGEARMQELEYEIFLATLTHVLNYVPKLQAAARQIATLDCLMSFADISHTNHYCRAKIVQDGTVSISQGRHPVVESVLGDELFVPNDTNLNTNSNQLLIITGPNMAGKSVYLRHVAIIVLLNQIGCFVPAQKATLSIVDRIFVRSGASDMISEGLSTFMVEMVETAQILQNATHKSLVIMDEIGRGTSTYDGISIAWSVAEYLVKNKKARPKTLFATHYHELQDLETRYPEHIKNYHMAIEDDGGDPVFLYTLLPGGASHSFGVAVAKLAGLPDAVLENAWSLLSVLEKRDGEIKKLPAHVSRKSDVNSRIPDFLSNLKIENITPLEALNILEKLKTWVS